MSKESHVVIKSTLVTLCYIFFFLSNPNRNDQPLLCLPHVYLKGPLREDQQLPKSPESLFYCLHRLLRHGGPLTFYFGSIFYDKKRKDYKDNT